MLQLLLGLSVAGLLCLLALQLLIAAQNLQRRWQQHHQRLRPFRVSARIDHTDDLFSFRLYPADSRRVKSFSAGQYITLAGPLLPSGKAAERRYSLANWHAQPSYYDVCIRREAQGKVSNWLHQHAINERILFLRPPAGDFILSQAALSSPAIVLIAGGVGITPMKSMLRYLLHCGYPGQVTLFQSVRNRAELLYSDEFQSISIEHANFHYQPALSRDITHTGEINGRIGARHLFAAAGNDGHYFFCAGQSMTDNLLQNLQLLGVHSDHLHYELFSAPASQCGNFTVQWNDRTLNAEGFPSLLQVLENMGATVDSDCRNGSCGRCRVRIVSGDVEQNTGSHTPAANAVLACCSRPRSDVVIDC